jgi:flavin reductase (DIM6/NTAB) family NADH-FMN oxidoreductase RutF
METNTLYTGDFSMDKASAVGHIPSGLFIICNKNQETSQIDGFLGSWVQQVSFSPLLVALCIKPGRPASDAIIAGEVFTINVVGEHNKKYLKHFWSGYDPEKSPFEELEYTDHNGSISLNESMSTITCKMTNTISPGDHNIIIAEVISSNINEENTKPMVHIRKSGLDY